MYYLNLIKDNLVSYWVPEQGEAPARVTIISIPRRNEVRVKNLYNVQQIEMAWQDQVNINVYINIQGVAEKKYFSVFDQTKPNNFCL